MKFRKNFSILALYNDFWEIFIQDRKNISTRWEEWWFFWWGVEEWETFDDSIIRETKEELNIDISDSFKHIWITKNFLEWFWEQITYMYIVKYDEVLHKDLTVLEWDWWKFVTLEEFLSLKIAPWTSLWIEMLKDYFNKNSLELKLEFPKD